MGTTNEQQPAVRW